MIYTHTHHNCLYSGLLFSWSSVLSKSLLFSDVEHCIFCWWPLKHQRCILFWNLKKEKLFYSGLSTHVCVPAWYTDSQICKHYKCPANMHAYWYTYTYIASTDKYTCTFPTVRSSFSWETSSLSWYTSHNGFLTQHLLGDIWEKVLTDLKWIIMSPTSLRSPFLFMVAYTLKL